MNFKNIHIGSLISRAVAENNIEMSRICNFLKLSEEEIEEMYNQKSIDLEILLRWSKLLEYDFFRLYSQHLILYAPSSANNQTKKQHKKETNLPKFRKNIYTKEIVDFVLEQISSEKMTKTEVIQRYRIPKTTLYKWIHKHKK